jgi:adenylate cyclase
MPEDWAAEDGALRFLDRDVPVDSKSLMRINYVNEPGSFTRLSYADAVDNSFDPDTVKHKIVLVGMTATGEPDSWVTPVSAEKMYGVEIYANAMDTILRQRFLVESSWRMNTLMVFLMVGLAGLTVPMLRLRWGALITAALFIGYLLAAFLAFDRGYMLNILYPLMVPPLVLVTVIVCRVVAEQSDRRHITDLFGRYVSPQVAGEIIEMANRDRLNLGGVRREITVLFADIRGFTTLSEQHEPEAIVAMLNKYLSIMIERILANDGMINKFAGDSVMAVWNAPQDQPDHALRAVKAALECQDIIETMEHDDASPAVQFGIGINSGHAVAGNVGSEGRSEYTIIGDTVNLASRLCSGVPGSHVWIGAQAYELVRDAVEAEELEPQYFKGKAEPVTAYRALRLRHQ